MKTSSRPITSGGSSRLHSTPASQIRGNGSLPRASIQARGVQSRSSTARVTPPDSSETTSGSSAPGPVSELTIALPDRCVSSVMTGPSKASQITSRPGHGRTPETERMASRHCRPGGPACRAARGDRPPGQHRPQPRPG